MNIQQDKKENIFSLPDISVKKTIPIIFVNKAVSLTFLIIVFVVITGLIIIFTVKTSISVSADGILVPSKILHIHSTESGIIKKILVNSGDTVKVNQALVYLDSTEILKNLIDIRTQIAADENTYNQTVKKAEYDKIQNKLSLESADDQLIHAKASFRDRTSSLFPKANFDSLFNNYKPGKNITIDYAMADIHSAQTAIRLSKLKILMENMVKYDLIQLKIDMHKLYREKESIKKKLKHLVLKSPVSGIILTEGLGELKGSYVSEGTKLLDIAETKNWDALLFVNGNDVHQVKMNDKVKIKFEGFQSSDNNKLYDASITSIGAEKISARDSYPSFTGLYRVSVKLKLGNKDKTDISKMKYGYKVNGEIITDSGKIVALLFKHFKSLF